MPREHNDTRPMKPGAMTNHPASNSSVNVVASNPKTLSRIIDESVAALRGPREGARGIATVSSAHISPNTGSREATDRETAKRKVRQIIQDLDSPIMSSRSDIERVAATRRPTVIENTQFSRPSDYTAALNIYGNTASRLSIEESDTTLRGEMEIECARSAQSTISNQRRVSMVPYHPHGIVSSILSRRQCLT